MCDLPPAWRTRTGKQPEPAEQPYDVRMPEETEYVCTHDAHDPESLTRHMNHMARDGWELLTVNFAIKGETGFHTFFWQRPRRAHAGASQPGQL
jgi:hypothetical protein